MLQTLAVENYRSLRQLIVPLARLNVVTGANGSGKSSLYRALRLLADTANSQLVASLAREGGLPSTLWAGPENITGSMRSGKRPVQGGPRKDAVRLQLGFASDDFGYAVDLGLPLVDRQSDQDSAFKRDPRLNANASGRGRCCVPRRR